MVKIDRAGAEHVKLNVISRMRKLGGFVQVAFALRNLLIQAGSSVCVHGNRGDQVFLECFWKGTNTRQEGKKTQDETEGWIVCPHHLPLKWFIPFLLISSYTCKMTSESCLSLYLPLPSDTIYREWIRARKKKGGIRRTGQGNKRGQR